MQKISGEAKPVIIIIITHTIVGANMRPNCMIITFVSPNVSLFNLTNTSKILSIAVLMNYE